MAVAGEVVGAAAPIRLDLTGPLAGRHVLVNLDALDTGVLEDLQSGQFAKILDIFERLLVGGDLPHGIAREGLRKLKLRELNALISALPRLFDIPNQG